ncbi:MAG: PASTA domain-containing protein [Bacteroidota bacterium]|jgi:beta-lactam-binding protein with PASTA domain|nr:PASTA domain-containing protein [Cytophagales bacterium]MCE2955624.1 PASTA domain-containing protein [Flammeovirgaceae bacterium]
MKLRTILKGNSIGSLLALWGIMFGVLGFVAIVYFYIYLPNVTNHGETIKVPDLSGLNMEEAEKRVHDFKLRIAVNDSSYSNEAKPLTILKQFPAANETVKADRTIYVSINRTTPPSLPMPDIADKSLINAEVVLKSSELKRGRLLYEPYPFRDLVKDVLYNGKPILPGTRIPKGSVIDLVVGDGGGAADFVVGNLVGDNLKTAILKLEGWNLHLGKVEIPDGVDTTGAVPFVFKQFPLPGDSVRIGYPIDLWIAPKGYKEAEAEDEETNN